MTIISALSSGSTGDDVKRVQEFLKALSLFSGDIDGNFGPVTRQSVIAFQQRYMTDGKVTPATYDAMERVVAAWANKDPPTLLVPIPNGLDAVKAQFGAFAYEEAAGGAIKITDDWAERNIVHVRIPVFGAVECHRLVEPVLRAIAKNLQDRGLESSVKTFGGCWVARHKMHNPKRGLSIHSWGIAVDINPSENPPGHVGNMDPNVVDVFARFGWEWAGNWKERDDMHFQGCTGV